MSFHTHTYAHVRHAKLTKSEREYLKHAKHQHALALRSIRAREAYLKRATRLRKLHIAMHSRRSFQKIYRGHNVHHIHKLPSA